MEDGPFTATIVDSVDIDGAVRYVVDVQQAPRRWLLWLRYNDFLALHRAVLALPSSALAAPPPPLPPKCYWPLGPDERFLAERLTLLQAYLTALASRPDLRALRPVCAFLSPPPPKQPTAAEGKDDDDAPPPFFPALSDDDDATLLGNGAGDAALRAIFVARNALRVASEAGSAARLAAAYDSQRAPVSAALSTLRGLLPALDAAAAAAPQKPHLAACADAVRSVERWAVATETAEAAVVRRAAGAAAGPTPVRPLCQFEAEVGDVIARLSAQPRAPLDFADDPQAMALLTQLREDMEQRGAAGQTASVALLRRLHKQLTAAHGGLSAPSDRVRDRQPPPSHVLLMLRRRGAELAATVAAVIAGTAPEGVAAEEVLSRVDQLASDVHGCSDEVHRALTPTHAADADAALAELTQLVADLRVQMQAPHSAAAAVVVPREDDADPPAASPASAAASAASYSSLYASGVLNDDL